VLLLCHSVVFIGTCLQICVAVVPQCNIYWSLCTNLCCCCATVQYLLGPVRKFVLLLCHSAVFIGTCVQICVAVVPECSIYWSLCTNLYCCCATVLYLLEPVYKFVLLLCHSAVFIGACVQICVAVVPQCSIYWDLCANLCCCCATVQYLLEPVYKFVLLLCHSAVFIGASVQICVAVVPQCCIYWSLWTQQCDVTQALHFTSHRLIVTNVSEKNISVLSSRVSRSSRNT